MAWPVDKCFHFAPAPGPERPLAMLRSLLGGRVEVMHATVGLCGVVSYDCPAQVPKTTGGSSTIEPVELGGRSG